MSKVSDKELKITIINMLNIPMEKMNNTNKEMGNFS